MDLLRKTLKGVGLFKLILELATRVLSQLPSLTQRKRKKFKKSARKGLKDADRFERAADSDD